MYDHREGYDNNKRYLFDDIEHLRTSSNINPLSQHRRGYNSKIMTLIVMIIVIAFLELITGGALIRGTLSYLQQRKIRSNILHNPDQELKKLVDRGCNVIPPLPIYDPIALGRIANSMQKIINNKKKSIAVGIFTVPRSNTPLSSSAVHGSVSSSQDQPFIPDYLYIEVMSILDTLMTPLRSSSGWTRYETPYYDTNNNGTSKHNNIDNNEDDELLLDIDYIHVFDGSPPTTGANSNDVSEHGKYFAYSPHVKVHRLIRKLLEQYKNDSQSVDKNLHQILTIKPFHSMAPHRKASLNYYLALQYLVDRYGNSVDGYLMLEDDLIFDPRAARIIYQSLQHLQQLDFEHFLIDGYARGFPRSKEEEEQADQQLFAEGTGADQLGILIPYHGKEHCCSQSFLLSPAAAKDAIPLIERSLNGSEPYLPLDLYLTSSLLRLPDFRYYFAKKCWVQHIGFPFLGLGTFHRGCSRMSFD